RPWCKNCNYLIFWKVCFAVVAKSCPLKQLIACNQIGLLIHENRSAAGQVINIIQVSYFITRMVDPFIMQNGIYLLNGCLFGKLIPRVSFEPVHFKAVMILPAAFTAWAVTGRESSDLIQEKQLRI